MAKSFASEVFITLIIPLRRPIFSTTCTKIVSLKIKVLLASSPHYMPSPTTVAPPLPAPLSHGSSLVAAYSPRSNYACFTPLSKCPSLYLVLRSLRRRALSSCSSLLTCPQALSLNLSYRYLYIPIYTHVRICMYVCMYLRTYVCIYYTHSHTAVLRRRRTSSAEWYPALVYEALSYECMRP